MSLTSPKSITYKSTLSNNKIADLCNSAKIELESKTGGRSHSSNLERGRQQTARHVGNVRIHEDNRISQMEIVRP